MFCCLRTCLNGNMRRSSTGANRLREPEIHLDGASMGPEVILLSNQLRITGCGGALATAPLVQSKSYFEVKIQKSGVWSVGLATRQTDLTNKFGGDDKESWCLCSDDATRHNGIRICCSDTAETSGGYNSLLNGNAAAAGLIGIEDDIADDVLLTTGSNLPFASNDIAQEHVFPNEGDIVGVAFDHVELNFYFNGKNLEVPYRNVKGAVYPVVFVAAGAILDVFLDNFQYGPPPGFDKIMIEQSLL